MLRCLGRVLRTNPETLTRFKPLFRAGKGWKLVRGGQSMTCIIGLKVLLSGLARLGPV